MATVLSRTAENNAEATSGHQHHGMMAIDTSMGAPVINMDCCGDTSGCDMAQCLSAASAVDNVLLGTSLESGAPGYPLMHKHVLSPPTSLFKPPISL